MILGRDRRPGRVDHRHAQGRRIAAGDRHRQAMGAIGMDDLQPHGRPGQSRVVGRPQVARLGHRAADQVPQPVVLVFPLAGVERQLVGHAPGRPPLRAWVTGPRRRTGWLRMRPRSRASTSVSRPWPSAPADVDACPWAASRGATTARTTRRVAELTAADDLRRRIRRPEPRAVAYAARLPGRVDLEHIGPLGRRHRHVPGPGGRIEPVGLHDLPLLGTPDRLSSVHRPEHGRRPHRHLGRIGPEDVVLERDGHGRRRRGHAGLGPRTEVEDQRVPGQPLHAHRQRGLRRSVVRPLEDRGDGNADRLIAAADDEIGGEADLDSGSYTAFGDRPRAARSRRPAVAAGSTSSGPRQPARPPPRRRVPR